MSNNFRPKFNMSLLFWNVAMILLYIFYECWVLWTPARPFMVKIQIPFYALMITYYVFACYVYLPYVFERFRSSFIRIISMIVLLIVYTIGFAAFNSILRSLIVRKWVFDISWTDLKLSSNRCLIVLGVSVGVWMARYLIMNAKQVAEFKIQKLEADKKRMILENAYLRSQLAPHLMFNSLSSIYNSVVKQSPKAPNTLELITQLLDYTLVNNKEGDTVPIIEDLKNLKKAIQLNKLVSVAASNMIYIEEIDDNDVRIAPLILQGLVDNIFKHGDLTDSNLPAIIKVKLYDNKLHYSSTNKIALHPSQIKRGIGLENVKQRLNILYPGRHTLAVIDGATHFEVDLIIFL